MPRFKKISVVTSAVPNIGNEPNVHAGLMFACELARTCRGKSEAKLLRLKRFADVDDKRERAPEVPGWR